MTSPIEEFVTELRRRCDPSGAGGSIDIADEVGDHLREIRDELVADGIPAGQAERMAVERFGSIDTVAKAYRSESVSVVEEVAILGAVMMVAYGVAGVVGSVVGSALGDTALIGEPSSATRAHTLVHVLVGSLGAGIAESLWLRRDGRMLRPGSRIARIGTILLVAVAALCTIAAFSSMSTGDEGICARWLMLAATSGVAIGVYRYLYRRDARRTALPATG